MGTNHGSELFAALDQSGLTHPDRVDQDAVQRAPLSTLYTLSEMAFQVTSGAAIGRVGSPFVMVSSLPLGGAPFPCSEIQCRLNRVTSLAQFAALYSDVVFVDCPISDLAVHRPSRRVNAEVVRKQFFDNLTILNYLRPLIEGGRIKVVTSPRCPHCHSYLGGDTDGGKRLRDEAIRMTGAHLDNVKFSARLVGGELLVDLQGPEYFVERGHGGSIFRRVPEWAARGTRLRRDLVGDGWVVIGRREARKFLRDSGWLQMRMNSIAYEFILSQTFDTSVVLDDDLEADVLTRLGASDQTLGSNEFVKRHLTTIVPFLGGIEPTMLLRLREDEGDAFVLFRQALKTAVEAQRASGRNDEKTAQTIYHDVVAPELATLDRRVTAARKRLTAQSRNKALAWTAAITLGLTSGLMPDGVVQAATAVGLVKVLAELAEMSLAKGTAEAEILEQKYYFLWKVRELSGAAHH